jgi:hypothetical protein
MAWNGYYEYDGTEIINGPRTEAYLVAAGKGWFIPTFEKPDFAAMLAQSAYTSPLTDGAPWIDPDLPESWEFYGYYPLNIDGAENSARTSSPVEFTIDGGTAGRLRHGTKSIVFNGLLMAGSERGAEYGMKWLRRVLLGGECSDRLTTEHSLGLDLTFFAAEPEVDADPPTEAFLDGGDPYSGAHTFVDPDIYDVNQIVPLQSVLRHFKGVTINAGPTVTSRHTMSCGGAVWSAQFTAVVGNPYEFGTTRDILQGYLDPTVVDPWVPGAPVGTHSTAPEPFAEVECGEDTWEPLFDPLYPALVVPPAPPSVPLGQFTPPSTWDRWKVGIPHHRGDQEPPAAVLRGPVGHLRPGRDPVRLRGRRGAVLHPPELDDDPRRDTAAGLRHHLTGPPAASGLAGVLHRRRSVRLAHPVVRVQPHPDHRPPYHRD